MDKEDPKTEEKNGIYHKKLQKLWQNSCRKQSMHIDWLVKLRHGMTNVLSEVKSIKYSTSKKLKSIQRASKALN
jgi:hypothetical protein